MCIRDSLKHCPASLNLSVIVSVSQILLPYCFTFIGYCLPLVLSAVVEQRLRQVSSPIVNTKQLRFGKNGKKITYHCLGALTNTCCSWYKWLRCRFCRRFGWTRVCWLCWNCLCHVACRRCRLSTITADLSASSPSLMSWWLIPLSFGCDLQTHVSSDQCCTEPNLIMQFRHQFLTRTWTCGHYCHRSSVCLAHQWYTPKQFSVLKCVVYNRTEWCF